MFERCLFQDTNVSLSMLSTNLLLHTSLYRDVLAHCRWFPLFLHSRVLYWVFSMWRYNGLHLRFLSWAFHVFAYDLAYEPDGWPWRQVRHISNLLFPPNLSDWILCGAHPGAGGFRDLIHRSKQCQMSSFISSPTHILCHRFYQLFHPAFPYFLSLRLKTLKLF